MILPAANRRIAIPQTWQEVAERGKLQAVMALFAASKPPLAAFADFPAEEWDQVSPDEMEELLLACSWMYTQPVDNAYLVSYNHKGKDYTFPAEDCLGFTCDRYEKAETFFTNINHETPEALDLCIGVLLIPKDEAYSMETATIEARAHAVSDMPAWVKFYALSFFRHVTQKIREDYWPVFDGGGAKSDNGQTDDGFPVFGWTGSFYSVAETRTFGDYKQVLASDFHEVLLYLTFLKKKELDTQAALEKQKRNG